MAAVTEMAPMHACILPNFNPRTRRYDTGAFPPVGTRWTCPDCECVWTVRVLGRTDEGHALLHWVWSPRPITYA